MGYVEELEIGRWRGSDCDGGGVWERIVSGSMGVSLSVEREGDEGRIGGGCRRGRRSFVVSRDRFC